MLASRGTLCICDYTETVIHGNFLVGPPACMCLPIAFSPGQHRLAMDSLTIITSGAPERSASVKYRPASNGILIAWK